MKRFFAGTMFQGNRGRLRMVIAVLGGAVLAGSILDAVVVLRQEVRQEDRAEAAPMAVADSKFRFRPHPAPRALPSIAFEDEKGTPLTLAHFRGKVLLLNIWATWCPPCRKEMPSLDRLQQQLGGPDFEVVALSIDHEGVSVVKRFFKEIDIRALAIYNDKTVRAGLDLGAVGIPTTLLIDRSGREIGRVAGPAEWDSPEAVETIQRYLIPAA
jgi:thiol-disulfide isomerase/thioredoxin